MNNADSEI